MLGTKEKNRTFEHGFFNQNLSVVLTAQNFYLKENSLRVLELCWLNPEDIN